MNARELLILWAALLALLVSPTLVPCYAARLPGDYMNEYTVGKYVTPHIPWAKPWAQGKLKIFFLTPFTGAAREVSEIWQRADIEVYGETTAATGDLGRTQGCFADVQDTAPEEKAARLVRKLSAEKYDVFVIGNFKWSALPVQVQYLLLEQVHNGAGLVIVYPQDVRSEIVRHPEASDREWVLSGVPIRTIPFFSQRMVQAAKLLGPEAVGQHLLGTCRLGKGRVAVLDYALDAPFEPCTGGMGLTPLEDFDYEKPACYEYYLSLVVRTILWAGQKPARVRLASLASTPVKTQAGRSTQLRVALQGQAEPGQGLKLRWNVRNRWGEHEGGSEMAIHLGGDSAADEPHTPSPERRPALCGPAAGLLPRARGLRNPGDPGQRSGCCLRP